MTAVLIMLLNIAIGYWNARVVGMVRAEAAISGRAITGLESWALNSARFISIIAFSMPLALVIMIAAPAYIPAEFLPAFQKISGGMFYISFATSMTGFGLIITIHSVKQAFDPNAHFLDRAVAVWNTGASIHNIVELATHLPKAFELIGDGMAAAGEVAASSDGESAPVTLPIAAGLFLLTIAAAILLIATCGGAYLVHLVERRGMASVMNDVGLDRDGRKFARQVR